MKCSKCGFEYEGIFCPNCGSKREEVKTETIEQSGKDDTPKENKRSKHITVVEKPKHKGLKIALIAIGAIVALFLIVIILVPVGSTETANNESDSVEDIGESSDTEKGEADNALVEENELKSAQYDAFVTLICSISDPPEFGSTEEETKYFEEQYDEWITGKSWHNILADEDGNPYIAEKQDYFIGTFEDEYSQRAYMESSYSGDGYYLIDINWGSSAWDNSHWSFLAYYDPNLNGLRYENGQYASEEYSDDGSVREYDTYSDGEGTLVRDGDYIIWNDSKEGNDYCKFIKASETSSEQSSYDSEYICEWATSIRMDESNWNEWLIYLESNGVSKAGDRTYENMVVNEIYARHGYIFTSEDLSVFFNSKSWYSPQSNDMNGIYAELSQVERDNIDFLKARN